jgi:hypothetical protein
VEKNRFKNFLHKFIKEIMEEDELEEATVTSDVQGYSTPFAFSGKSKNKKKKNKRISTNSTGYKVVKENKETQFIRKLIRKELRGEI